VTALLGGPVALVGLMASGKSSVGKRLAARVGAPFVDSDREIEQRAGCTVAELFATEGEAGFRAREAAVLAELLAESEPQVVATGGGSVLDAGTRAVLRRRATVVWLRASPALLASRCRADGTRPLLADDPRATLERLAVERSPLYEEVADHVIDVDSGDRRLILDAVLAAVAPAALSLPVPVEESSP
jgi:shikimate kinase